MKLIAKGMHFETPMRLLGIVLAMVGSFGRTADSPARCLRTGVRGGSVSEVVFHFISHGEPNPKPRPSPPV